MKYGRVSSMSAVSRVEPKIVRGVVFERIVSLCLAAWNVDDWPVVPGLVEKMRKTGPQSPHVRVKNKIAGGLGILSEINQKTFVFSHFFFQVGCSIPPCLGLKKMKWGVDFFVCFLVPSVVRFWIYGFVRLFVFRLVDWWIIGLLDSGFRRFWCILMDCCIGSSIVLCLSILIGWWSFLVYRFWLVDGWNTDWWIDWLGCLRFTKFRWVEKHVNIIMKPTNYPTQGQPNPRKNGLQVAFGPLFPTEECFLVGWDWFYMETNYKKPNPTKLSANTLM